MKLEPLAPEQKNNRIKMIITEDQLRRLAANVITEQEEGTIKKTHLIKINNDVKKKK